MSVRPLPYSFPAFAAQLAKITDHGTQQVIQQFVNDVDKMLKNIAMVSNYNFRLLDELAGPFFASATVPPSMKVTINPGFVWVSAGPTLTKVALQSVGPFTAPVGNPRIDRIVVTNSAGVASIVAGTPNANPVPPAIPASNSPVCQVLLQPSTTQIQQINLTDERALSALGV